MSVDQYRVLMGVKIITKKYESLLTSDGTYWILVISMYHKCKKINPWLSFLLLDLTYFIEIDWIYFHWTKFNLFFEKNEECGASVLNSYISGLIYLFQGKNNEQKTRARLANSFFEEPFDEKESFEPKLVIWSSQKANLYVK